MGKLADILGVARMTSMLSGLAVPKSIVGNLGAITNEAIERRSLAPIKQFFKTQTAKDFGRELIRPSSNANLYAGGTAINPFGRIMGAGDTATRRALQRAGLTPTESERAVLQAPIDPKLASALQSRIGRFAVPFRRTPINQFTEGMETLKGKHPALLASHIAAGAATGAVSEEEQYPILPAIYSAFAGRYAIPAIAGAVYGRKLAEGRGTGGLVESILPISGYGLEQSLLNPVDPLNPENFAMLRVLRRLRGEN